MKLIIPGNIDVMVIGEHQLHVSYPTSQLLIGGFSESFRLDRNSNGGHLLFVIGRIYHVDNCLIIHYLLILRV